MSGGRFGRLGVAFGVHLGCLGLPLEFLGRHLGVFLEVFGCWGGPFWRSMLAESQHLGHKKKIGVPHLSTRHVSRPFNLI